MNNHLLRGWALCIIIGVYGGAAKAEQIVHSTSTDFQAGSFFDVEDTGTGGTPAIKMVYSALPFTIFNGSSFGDGQDNDATISGDPNTRAACSGSAGQNSLSTTLSAAAGDVVLIHQSRGSGAGTWELHRVTAVGGSTLYFADNLANAYSGQAQAVLVPQYNNLTVTGGGPASWNGTVGGIYAVICKGTFNVTGTLSANGGGYRGGIHSTLNSQGAFQGEGTAGAGSRSTSPNGNGGGGGNGGAGGGGGNGGGGGTSTNGTPGGNTSGNAALTNATFGGGGGGSSWEGGDPQAGDGGAGGGLICCLANTVNVTGSLRSIGNNGGNSTHRTGGGGAGGSILVRGKTVAMGTTSNAGGGAPGSGDPGSTGGTGGTGRIRVETPNGLWSGSTSPSASSGSFGYKTSGTYRSAEISIAGCSQLGTLLWTTSGGTSVQVRTRTASTSAGLSSASWSSYLTSSGSQITSPSNDWIQYEVALVGTSGDSPTLSSVTINYETNVAPTAFNLVSPADQTPTSNNRIPLVWQSSTDPEGQPIEYQLELASNAGFAPLHRLVTGLSSPSYSPAIGQEIANGTYYWRVTASDGEKTTVSTQTWQFTVNGSPPAIPTITGVLSNAATGKIARLIVEADSSQGQQVTLYVRGLDGGSFAAVSGSVDWDGDVFTFTPDSELEAGSTLYVSVGASPVESRRSTLAFENIVDIFVDTTVFHGSGPGASIRLEMDTVYRFKAAVNGGSQVTVMAQLRRNAAYGTGTQPTITLTGLGITGTGGATTSLSVGADAWQELTVTGTPNADGILTLTVQTFGTNAGAATWIDDISVSQ